MTFPDAGLAGFVEKSARLVLGHSLRAPGTDRAQSADDAAAQDAEETLRLVPLAGDGSTRRIYRAWIAGDSFVVVANPQPPGRVRPDENEAFIAVRQFLHRRGIPVPRFYTAALEEGFMLLEDLGDVRLFDRVKREGWDRGTGEGGVVSLYRQAIGLLVAMQAPGATAFDAARVSNPAYTEDFILEMEAGYFHAELVRGLAGLDRDFRVIEPECRRIARRAAEKGASRLRFMHRDFQSRNLMVADETLAVIDFQGARLGPPEYDLASLLFDPYVAMPDRLRLELLRAYLDGARAAGLETPRSAGMHLAEAAGGAPPGSPVGLPRPEAIRDEATATAYLRFLANAADRLMQALGAFAKLGGRMGRPGFREHIPQALTDLAGVLAALGDCPRLSELVAELRTRRAPL